MRFRPGVIAALAIGLWVSAPSVVGAVEPSSPDLSQSRSIDSSARAAVDAAYLSEWFKPAVKSLPAWDGDSANCRAGTVRDDYIESWKTRTNFVRALADLDPVTYERSHNSELQQAALVQSVRFNSLSHYPPPNTRCFTESALTGSSTSNLSFGPGENVYDHLLSFMTDSGSGNVDAGHRAWNLEPSTTSMGIGYVSPGYQYAAQKVIGTTSNAAASKPAWVAWPTAGYFPRELEPEGRWSITRTDTTLSLLDAKVTVSGANGTNAAHVEYASARRLSFRPAESALVRQDGPLVVQVSGIRRADGSAAPNYSYEVQLFDPQVYEYTPRVQEARVGQTLTPAPTDRLSRYADGTAVVGSHDAGVDWFVDGNAIGGGNTFTPQPEHFGKRLTAVIRGVNDRFDISGVAAVVEYGLISQGSVSNPGQADLDDDPYAGRKVAAYMSDDWTIENTTEKFQWLLAGKPITGSTAASIVPKAAWAGKALQVRVTGSALHATSATFTSAPQKVMLQQAVRPRYVSTRSKVKRFKKYVKVSWSMRATWDLKPTAVRYRWYVNGKLTKTTTKASSSIKITRRGKSVIKMRITAERTNHRDYVTTRTLRSVKR